MYEANMVQWKAGDLVIHECDAKCSAYLMRVVGFARDGLVRTEYVEQGKPELARFGRGKRSTLLNPMAVLHDPSRWAIDPSKPQQRKDGE